MEVLSCVMFLPILFKNGSALEGFELMLLNGIGNDVQAILLPIFKTLECVQEYF